MGRRPRVEYKGAVYHVIQRGNNREYIFEKEEYKLYLMKLVKEYKGIMGYEIYGFVIMDNHYHMVIRTLDSPLQNIMHRINNQYSKYYNYKNKRTGHTFENRYKGILVKEDEYLLSLIRYVHQNPVRAYMCKRVEDYKWSSDLYYRLNLRHKIVDIDFLLDILSKDRVQSIKLYKKFMDTEDLEESSRFEEALAIGENVISNPKTISSEATKKKSLDEILREVTGNEAIYEDIKRGSRKRNLTSYKREYVKRSLGTNYTMKEIGENISISDVAIFKISNRKEENKGYLSAIVE